MNMRRHLGAVVISLGILASDNSGCSHDETASRPAAASQGSEATPPEQPRMSDGQILYVISTVDTAEIAQAEVARERATSAAVNSFAQDMIRAHTGAKQQGERLLAEKGIVASDSQLAQKLRTQGEKALADLQAAGAMDFDAQYVKAQIRQHREVLDMIQHQLVPAANDAHLRGHLSQAAQMVSQHLEQAQQLQTTLPNG